MPTDAKTEALINNILRLDERTKPDQEKAGIALRRLVARSLTHYRHEDVVQVLNAYPEIVNSASPTNGRTALHYAAENGNVRAFDLLINREANFHIRDRNQQTPAVLLLRNAGEKVARRFRIASTEERLTEVKRPEFLEYKNQLISQRNYLFNLMQLINACMTYGQRLNCR